MVTNTARSSVDIRREDIKLTDRDILHRYLGIDKVPCVIQSPLREDDDTPSFSFREWKDSIVWKDFGTGESGNIVSLLAKLWCLRYPEALQRIKSDSENKVPKYDLVRKYTGKIKLGTSSTLKVKVRRWKDWDIEYWRSYGISQSFCKWCNVYPVSTAFFTKKLDSDKEVTISVPMDKYAYAYFEWKDGKESIKLYQPYSQTMKWLSKHDSSVWDLWQQAFNWAEKKSDECVILTSSRKDAMCLWENLKVPAMALQGEGYLPKPKVIKQVLNRFKTVYIWYDNDFTHSKDNPGQDNARKLIELYPSLKNIVIPKKYKSKDPSDLYKNWGKDILEEIWNQR